MKKSNLYTILLAVSAIFLIGIAAFLWQQREQVYLSQEVLWNRVSYELKVQRIDDEIIQIEAYKDNKPFDLFQNEILIHVAIVSSKLHDIDHQFLYSDSDQISPGVYQLSYPFKQDYDYLIWVETNNVES
ncbi:MAG: hypothetical protein WD000_03385, partial [Thermodesulfobacteriota bacterium]